MKIFVGETRDHKNGGEKASEHVLPQDGCRRSPIDYGQASLRTGLVPINVFAWSLPIGLEKR